MDNTQSLNQALKARIASLEVEAKILRSRRLTSDNEATALKRQVRQISHKLEERTLRVRRLERGCKLGLGNLRRQDSEGLYWCRTDQEFEPHLVGVKNPGCRYCLTYSQVTAAIEGRDIDDGYSPSVSGSFDIPDKD
jgi:hypothetical protein